MDKNIIVHKKRGKPRQKRSVRPGASSDSTSGSHDETLSYRLGILETWLAAISETNAKGAEYLNELRRAAQRCVVLVERKQLLGENISPNVLARERDRAKDMVDKAQKSLCRSKVHRQSWFPALSKRLKHLHGSTQNQFTRWLGKAVVSGDQAQLPRMLRVPAAKLQRLVGPQPPHPIALPRSARSKGISMVESPRVGESSEGASMKHSGCSSGSSVTRPRHASSSLSASTMDCHSPASIGGVVAPTSLSVSRGVSPTVSRESCEGSDDDARQAATSRIAAAALVPATTAMREIVARRSTYGSPRRSSRRLKDPRNTNQDAPLRLRLHRRSGGSVPEKNGQHGTLAGRDPQYSLIVGGEREGTPGCTPSGRPLTSRQMSAPPPSPQIQAGELRCTGSTFVMTTVLPVTEMQRAQSMPATLNPRRGVVATSSNVDEATAGRMVPEGTLQPRPASLRSMMAPIQGTGVDVSSSLRDSAFTPSVVAVEPHVSQVFGVPVRSEPRYLSVPLPPESESAEYGQGWFSLSRLPMASADSKSVKSGAGSFHEGGTGAPSGRWSSCSLDGPGPGAFFSQSTGSRAGSATGANTSVDDDAIPGLWAEVATAPQQSAGHGGFEAIPAASSSSCAARASGAEIPLMSAQGPPSSQSPASADSFIFASSPSPSWTTSPRPGELSPSHSPALGLLSQSSYLRQAGSRSSPSSEYLMACPNSQLAIMDGPGGGADGYSEAVVQQVPLARRAGGAVGEIQVGIAIGSKRSRDDTGDSGLSGAGAVTGDFGLEQVASVVRKRPRH